MGCAASQAGDADSSHAPGLASGATKLVNLHYKRNLYYTCIQNDL